MNTDPSQFSHPSLIRPLHPNSHASSGNFGPQQKSFQNNNPNAPYSFMLNSNVQENYSAYRLNGNMGMPNQGSASSHNPRIGFFGEVYSKNTGPQNNGPQYNLSLVSPPQNKNSSKFFQNGMSVVSPQSLQNVSRSPPPEFAYKPSPFGQSPQASNPLLNQNFASPPLKTHFIDSGYNNPHPNNPHRPMQLQRMPSHGHSQSMHQAPINLPPIYTPQNKHLAHHMKSPSSGNIFHTQQQLNQSISRLEKVVSGQNEIIQHLIHNNASFMHDSTRKPSSRQGIKPLNLNLNQSVHNMKPLNLNTTLNDSHRSYGNNTPTNMNHTVQHYEDSASRLPSVNNIPQHQNGDVHRRVVGKNLLINVLSKMKSEPVPERGTSDAESLDRLMSNPASPQHFQTKKSEKTSQESLNLDTREESSVSTLQETSTPILKSKRFEFGSLEKLGSRKNIKDNRDRKPRSKKVVTINSEIELLGEDSESPKLPPTKPLDLRQILWSMIYPFFLAKKIDEKVAEKKKKIEQFAPKEIEKQNNIALQFIQKHCQSSLKSIYKASNCQLVKDEEYGDSDISEKSTKKRFLNIITKLTVVLQDVNKGLDKVGLPSEFSQYFRNITDNGSVLPPKFLTEYESSLLEFSYYGTLKHMAPAKLKMILASFFLIKKLTYCMMAKPWDFSSKVKKSVDLQRNLKSFSSVLYAIIMGTFKDLKQTKANQAFIHPDKRVKVLKPLLAFEDESTENPRLKNEALHHEVLFGMYRRTLLDLGFDTYPEEVEKVKKLVEECIEKLYEQVVFNQDKIAENNAK